MQYFGTDGIRRTSEAFFEDDLALRVGYALAGIEEGKSRRAVIGRDTRVSGTAIEDAVVRGLVGSGYEVLLLGIIPTPAVAFCTLEYEAEFGIMISASHNPPHFNGIKIFGSDGYKLNARRQQKLEELIEISYRKEIAGGMVAGVDAREEYLSYLTRTIGGGLEGANVRIDAGYGAASYIASELFLRMGASVETVCEGYKGALINVHCGSTYLENLKMQPREEIGLSFDGDADRVLGKSTAGDIIDGDAFLYILSQYFQDTGRLKENTVVGTILSNTVLEQQLVKRGIRFVRTDVGDQFVQEEMVRNDYALGGEQSGHIILDGPIKTGDGILAGALLVRALRELGLRSDEIKQLYRPCPSISVDIACEGDRAEILRHQAVLHAEAEARRMLEGNGFIVLRKSGTEPKIRIMTQSTDPVLAKKAADGLETAVFTAKNALENNLKNFKKN